MKILIALLIPFLFIVTSFAKITVALPPLCPYYCPQSEEASGYISFIIKEALAPEEVNFIKIPEGRLKKGLLDGDYQLAVLPSLEIVRESNLFVSSPALGLHFLGKASLDLNLSTQPISEVKNKSLTILKGKTTNEFLENKLSRYPNWKTNQITYISGSEISKRMLFMLKLKRTDLILSDYNALSYEILNQKLKEQVHLRPSSLSGFTPLVLVSKDQKNQKVFNRIRVWIHQSRKNGVLLKLLEKYNLEDWDIYNTRF